MKKNRIWLFLMICAFNSCEKPKDTNSQNEKINQISIDKIQNRDFPFSEFCDSIRNVALETNKDFVIGNIDKVAIFEDLIFVLDREITQAVFIYTTRGESVALINNKGKGPEEYLSAEDITIDRGRKEVLLLDSPRVHV